MTTVDEQQLRGLAQELVRLFAQLEDQVQTLRANTTKPVVGGVLVWKARGSADPATWRTITTLNHLPELIGD